MNWRFWDTRKTPINDWKDEDDENPVQGPGAKTRVKPAKQWGFKCGCNECIDVEVQ